MSLNSGPAANNIGCLVVFLFYMLGTPEHLLTCENYSGVKIVIVLEFVLGGLDKEDLQKSGRSLRN